MTMPVKNYRSDLLVRLANPEYAANYLKASLEATLEDGDRESFLLAVRNVAAAQASTQTVTDPSEFADIGLQEQFKDTETLTVETLLSVLDTVGLTLEFKPA
jgi:DNA-binding phage protein